MAGISFNHDTKDMAVEYSIFNQHHQLPMGLKLVEKLGPLTGKRILDLGCGTGDLALHIAKNTGAEEVVGVDPTAERIKVANSRLTKENDERKKQGLEPLALSFEIAAAENLSKFHGRFDAVLMNYVLHWVRDSREAFMQIHKALRPGGRVIFSMPSKDHPRPQDIKGAVLSEKPYSEYPQKGVALYLWKTEIETLLDDTGFGKKNLELDKHGLNFPNAAEFEQFMSSSSFGNLYNVDHLPPALRESASKEIKRRFQEAGNGGKVDYEMSTWIVVATRS